MMFQTVVDSKLKKHQFLQVLWGFLGTFIIFSVIDWYLGRFDWTRYCFFPIYTFLYSLIPYFRLRRMKQNPDYLVVEGRNLIYVTKRKRYLSIPLSAIEGIKAKKDGIGLVLKKERSERILTLQPKGNLAQFSRQGKSRKCDLFFMYFPESVKAALEEVIRTPPAPPPSKSSKIVHLFQ